MAVSLSGNYPDEYLDDVFKMLQAKLPIIIDKSVSYFFSVNPYKCYNYSYPTLKSIFKTLPSPHIDLLKQFNHLFNVVKIGQGFIFFQKQEEMSLIYLHIEFIQHLKF